MQGLQTATGRSPSNPPPVRTRCGALPSARPPCALTAATVLVASVGRDASSQKQQSSEKKQMLYLAFAAVVASADPNSCLHTSLCTTGNALNVTNATGVCDKTNPFWPGTKECTVCAGCHQIPGYESCACCQPLYNDALSCSLCTVRDAQTRSKCGNPQFAYRCDTSGSGCVAVPGTIDNCENGPGGPYLCFATQEECSKNCNTYNCVNDNMCVKVPKGTPAKYPSLAACNQSCSTAPMSACGLVKPAQCRFWQDLFDATGGPIWYPGAPNNWTTCNGLRDDPCECGGKTCDGGGGGGGAGATCVTCKNGDITAVNLISNNMKGTIPSSIGAMTSMAIFDLSSSFSSNDNHLNGTLPSSLGELTSLTSIRLTDNQLTFHPLSPT
jgi:hypothetical protein